MIKAMRCVLGASALALTLALLGWTPTPVWACAIDGVPTAFANGRVAVIFNGAPTTATYAWWARFVFPQAYSAGQPVAFREDDARIRKVLAPFQYDRRRSWQWQFGDGTQVTADAARHVYRRAGHYRVTVNAYFRNYGWKSFDTITIVINR